MYLFIIYLFIGLVIYLIYSFLTGVYNFR